jgi:hypothetical protein
MTLSYTVRLQQARRDMGCIQAQDHASDPCRDRPRGVGHGSRHSALIPWDATVLQANGR